jgi:glutamate--cysteine ligase catalytic subunit
MLFCGINMLKCGIDLNNYFCVLILQVESTPSSPYSNYVSDLLRVEKNMILRRSRLLSALAPGEIIPYVTAFPLMGVGDFFIPPLPEGEDPAPNSKSEFVPDCVINPHPRFGTLTHNIRSRRGSKVDIRVPLFHDVNTPEFLAVEDKSSSPDIYMDCMAFGMGMCCLQVTFQARDVNESRYMFDQLHVLSPIMMALTAATPIFKGRLADIDARWTAIEQSVDCRTAAERSVPGADLSPDTYMAGGGVTPISKSRYDSISTYIYQCPQGGVCPVRKNYFNDIPCEIDEESKSMLMGAGVDEYLAHHIAHLFTRDPLVIFEGGVDLDDWNSTNHFENIQSTNWQTVRWKPPPPRVKPEDPHIGWRTEFRTMEIQLSDFENAAFTIFVVLVTRVILAFDLDLMVPLSKVDENMKRGHARGAVATQKFHFRKFVAPLDSIVEEDEESEEEIDQIPAGMCGKYESDDDFFSGVADEEMTVDEIFNGKSTYFPGLIPLVYAYLEYVNCDEETFTHLNSYLQFISKKASGELMTTATWIRNFVTSHEDYKGDSVVSESIAYDLMMRCKAIGEGDYPCPELHGDVRVKKVRPEDAYGQVLQGRLQNKGERQDLLQRLVKRAQAREPGSRVRGMSLHDLEADK